MNKYFLIIFPLLLWIISPTTTAQSVNGPTSVNVGQTYEYSFNNGTIYPNATWTTSNMGTVSKLTNIGATHRANIIWNSPGTATVSFLNNYQLIGSGLTVVVNVGTPNTSFSISQVCGSTTVTRNTNPPVGVNWYWQTSAGGTSTSLGSGSSTTITTATTLYLRARWGTTGAWSSGSQSVGTVAVKLTPAVPATSSDGHRISNTATAVPLSVSTVSGATGYRWYDQSAAGNLVATTTTAMWSPNLITNKTYWVASLRETCESTSRKAVSAYLHPEPGLFASNGSVVSLGTPVVVSAPNYSYDSYSWLDENETPLGVTSPTLTLTKGGIFKLRVTKGTAPAFITPVGIKVSSIETQAENFIISNTILTDNVTTDTQITTLPVESLNQVVQYYDGLGRPLQSIVVQGSPTKNDVVQPNHYDVYGRESLSFLPVSINEKNGQLKTGIIDPTIGYTGKAAAFYSIGSDNMVEDDERPFGTTVFDDSPVNKPLKIFSAGKDWFDKGKSKEQNELVNKDGTTTGSERIINWMVNASGLPVRDSYYRSGILAVDVVKDENGNLVRQYSNRLGQVVLKKTYLTGDANLLNSTTNWAQTYYIYDDRGQLRYVLQPELVKILAASTSSNPTQVQLAQYAFQYSYDSRQRLIMKCLPGAACVYLVYDGRDRLVATQDGNQRAVNPKEWLVTKYDQWNRVVATALYNSDATREDFQETVNNFYQSLNSTKAWFETYGGAQPGYTAGYDNKSFPSLTEAQVLTVTYYDRYDSYIAPTGYTYNTTDLPGQESTHSNAIGGLVTGTKVKNLADGTLYRTVNYYDGKYRQIQSISDHQKGTLRITNILDFPGRVVVTKRTYVVNGVTTSVRETTTYDHGSRVINVKQSINGRADIILFANTYNELGELVDKKLHSENNGVSFKQSIDYRYNIRGWLTKINEANISNIASGDNSHDYFGMELFYNKVLNGVNNVASFNGNISAIQWSKGNGDGTARQAYRFQYDRTNQLLGANHFDYMNLTWLPNNNAFDEVMTYDMNGNIKTLIRKGANGFPQDNLVYGYVGNRLDYVHDTGDHTTGFVNGNTGTDDYSYDANGNLIKDKNKGLSADGSISYNYLNLPKEVIKGGESIKYTYDATGKKLTQLVYNGGSLVKRTDYIGELVYEGDVLKFISTYEGRAVADGTNWEYQYFLKDHLGNVRVTFTTKPQPVSTWTATFESGTQSAEQSNFKNYTSTVFDLVDHTDPGTTYQKVQLLNGGSNGRVGLVKSIEVMPGDEVRFAAYGKYMNLRTAVNPNSFVTCLTSAFGVSATSVGDQLRIYDGLNTYAGMIPGGEHSNDDDAAPKAFVTILFFDRDFHFLDAAWDQMTTAGAQTSTTTKQPHDLLSVTAKAREAGYAFVFLSNEHPTFVDVYFDDVSLVITPSPIISVADYYPYGLQYNAGERFGSLEQKLLYNTKELQDELSLTWYDYGSRMYMPEIGRWSAIDPLAEKYRRWSPYNYTTNNPVRFIDPDGMDVISTVSGTIYTGEDAVRMFLHLKMMKAFREKYNPNTIDQREWASKGPYQVHQKAMENGILRGVTKKKNINEEMKLKIQALKDATRFADAEERQKAVWSFTHAMRNVDIAESVEEAKAKADKYVRDNFAAAKKAYKNGQIYEAYYYLGLGLHTLQDATSPSHHGFQPWSDFHLVVGRAHPQVESLAAHVRREMHYPGVDSNLQKVTNQYLDWLTSDSDKLPSENLFNSIKPDK